jgi:hypothetical protein
MKKIMTIIGMASVMLLSPSCKKSSVKPQEPAAQQTKAEETAQMYVLLDSKPCSTPQSEYTSATVDIREIKVFNNSHGWESLTTVPGAWDVVSLQTAPVPVADLTEHSTVHAGTISKISLIIGTNNELVVNNVAQHCYNISQKEIVLDLEEEINVNTLNELVVSIDICGNFSVSTKYDQDPCYTLKPVMAVEGFKSMPLVK